MSGTAKSIILHIGANKTGSSAIQEFLRLNAVALPRFGVHVAPSDLSRNGKITGQHVWFIEQQRKDVSAGRKRITRRMERLMAGLEPGSRLVISAENLALRSREAGGCNAWRLNGAHQLFADVARQYPTQIVLYVRRQDELLLSSWQQWESKVSDDFWAWMLSATGREGDWREVLEAWETVVPRESISVRVYERERMPEGDVVCDFAQVLGLNSHLGDLQRPRDAVNPSYADAIVDIAKGNRVLFRDEHDNEFYNVVEQLTEGRYRREPNESVLTHVQRCAILERYEESNCWVRERYFPASTAPLFTAPAADACAALGRERLEAQKWEVMASLIFGLARRALR